MMKTKGMILCEGKTDRDLLGYYLEETEGWNYLNNKHSPFPKETINWYKRNDTELGIWAVEGNDFHKAIETVLGRVKLESSIEKLAIVTDHDDREAESDRPKDLFDTVCHVLEIEDEHYEKMINQWYRISFQGSFISDISESIEICYLLVPYDEQGALETFMMNSLAESSPEKDSVIRQSREFIQHFSSEYYLKRRREKIKAELGVTMTIFSPDRVFTVMDELIQSVHWSEFDTVNEQFALLRQI